MIGTILSTLLIAPAALSPMPRVGSLATLSAAAVQQNKVEISVTPDAGASIKGETTFTVKVASKNPVNQVEFYVGSDLRESDTSTPYEFKLDTLALEDGPLKLTFAAYTTEGESSKKEISVTIDNGVSKGAEFHVQAGNDYLVQQKWDDAIRSGRVALKAKPGFNPARLLMARAFRGKGILDSAQKFAEDALAADPKFYEAADFLSAINLERAFNTFNRDGKRLETLAVIRDAMISAVNNRRTVLDASLDRLGPATDANRLQVADAAIRAGRYSVAIAALSDAFRKNSTDVALGNRLAFAQIRAGRPEDAQLVLQEMRRVNALDGYGYALAAVLDVLRGRNDEADAEMKEAILNDPDGLGIQTAQAWIALKRGRNDVLRSLSGKLSRDAGQLTETNYYLAIMNNIAGDFTAGRKAFETAVLAEPSNYAMYVQRGNEAMSIVVAGRVEAKELEFQAAVARAFYDTALVAKPESAEALTGVAIISVFNKKMSEAVSFARAATAAGRGYAAAHYAQAMIFSRMEADLKAQAERIRDAARGGNLTDDQRRQINQLTTDSGNFGREAIAAQRRAEQLDPGNLSGRGIADPSVCFAYFARHGRMPLLVAPR